MRSRLVLTFATLMALAIALLAVPLARDYSSHRTGRLLLDRRADATRFADLADQAARDGDRATLNDEIRRYADLYGAAVRVRNRDGVLVASAGDMAADDRDAVRLALSGRTTEDLPEVTPFGPRAVLVAEPAGRDAQVTGVVLVESPAGAARADVAAVWGALALGALAGLGCAVLAARRLAWWVLRPVTELDELTRAMAQGRRDVRAVPRAGPGELRRLEERFNAMADAVSGSFERQRTFVHAASHELRNPLGTVIMQVENGRNEAALAELERLVTLVEGLLRLARVEHRPVVEDVDVAAELRTRAEGWREPYTAKGLDLVLDLPESPRRPAVPGAVAQIADIALENAVKFLSPGRRVVVSLDGPVLRIADDGPGLPADEHDRALGHFWRSRTHTNVPGNGLGLAIAAELARACGGALAVLPNEPHGLIVELRLPAQS